MRPHRESLPPKQPASYYAIILLLVIVSFLLGYLFSNIFTTRSISFPILEEATQLLQRDLPANQPLTVDAEYGMIRGLLTTINDPFASFFNPTQYALLKNQLDGEFGGIGIRLERDSALNVRLYPLPNSPAKAVGLQEQDILLAVDDLHIAPAISLDELQAQIRGPIGASVKLLILRENQKNSRTYSVVRTEVAVPSVSSFQAAQDPRVGIIQIRIFGSSTSNEVESAITQMAARGATAFVIDLRDNSGGLIESGANSARLFLADGLIIFHRQLDSAAEETIWTSSPGDFVEIPLSILVNSKTAGAAEVFAGALQYHRKAQLVGCQTAGNGTIQIDNLLSDGSALRLTAGAWLLPNRTQLGPTKGLAPEILIDPMDANSASALERAVKAVAP